MIQILSNLPKVSLLFLITSCNSLFQQKSISQITKVVGDVNLEMNYISPESMAAMDGDGNWDSLISEYSKQLTFNLKISSTDENQKVIFRNISTEDEYNDRLYQLNFETEPLFWISNDSTEEHDALLTHFVRTPSMNNLIEVVVVFPQVLEQGANKEFTVSFSDQVFQTGIHHFSYNTKHIISQQNQSTKINPS